MNHAANWRLVEVVQAGDGAAVQTLADSLIRMRKGASSGGSERSLPGGTAVGRAG